MWRVFALARILTYATQGGIALVGMIIVAIIGVWQLSGQKTPNDILGAISSWALIGFILVFLLFVSRVLIDGRDEYNRDKNANALKIISRFIGEGNDLMARIEKEPNEVIREKLLEKWEERVTHFLDRYDSVLTSRFRDTSSWIEIGYPRKSSETQSLLNRIGPHMKTLGELMLIIAVHR